MPVIDFLLNLAGLLMWLSWCGVGAAAPSGPAGTLLGNLRSAEGRTPRRWSYLAALVGLLFVRALFYRQIGPSLGWHPTWNAGVVGIPFRSDLLGRMLAYSVLSFGWFLFVGYGWMVFIAAVNHPPHDRDGVTRVIRRHLGGLASLPAPLLLLLPELVLGLAWLGIGSWVAHAGLIPAARDWGHLGQQAVVVGLGAVLGWRWLLTLVCLLHLLANYVYFGRHAFWEFIQRTGERLARPVAWARWGRLDLSPLLVVMLVWTAALLLAGGWPGMSVGGRRPPAWLEFGWLPMVFRSLPW